ncbi:LOW QUALITY PROTEIN: solute carrier organic anion transporter family member 1B3 [Perognathus longimembris pacificus]|uniref:LOW QUALITY PROTEIN: solute carrier organic anion transporter family member 1B3 n=1 Tax=Perognathus longimembris pacificus TaxID=214514 RepID=UPI002018FB53|nr:LOW QUALITY PROTEIN: solute carrier organic anion transporter family member 1B3 [Perognathus longimembris pacificus]
MDQNQNKKEETKSPEKRKTRRFDRFKIFLAAISFSFICKTFAGVLMKSSLTQIEKRFDISSSTSGFIDGGFEFGNLFVIVFVSYFGSKLHRPKLIGIGSLVMGTGCFLIALPHFLMGRYRYDTGTSSDPLKGAIPTCSINRTSSPSTTSPKILEKGCDRGSENYYWIYVLLGNMLRGVGETPIVPLGVSYIDDFSEEGNSSIYLGGLQAITMIGPILGFIMGSVFSRIYVDVGFVDLSSVRITTRDARWVGAWWLGFLVAGLLCILSAIPFFFLPKNPRELQAARKGSVSSAQGLKAGEETGPQAHPASQGPPEPSRCVVRTWGSGFLMSMRSILSNKLYILFLTMTLLHLSAFIGSFTYVFKYIEQQYGQPTSHANFLLGLITIPTMASGMLLGGYSIKKFKLTVVGIGKLSFCTALCAVFTHLIYFSLICEGRSVGGLTVAYDGNSSVQSHMNLSLSPCNVACGCEDRHWEPVCGDNGVTYLSPCLAGCSSDDASGNNTVFHNCTCVRASGSPNRNYSAHLGECPRSDACKMKFKIYIGVQVIYSFFLALGSPSYMMLLVRLVEPELKSLAMGFHSLVIRTLGGMLAPICFGTLIDMTCIKWSITPCGKKGTCRMYNSILFGAIYLGLQSCLKFVSLGFFATLIWAMKKKYEGKATKEMGNEEKATDEEKLDSVNKNGHFVSETHI